MVHLSSNSTKLRGRKARKQESKKDELNTLIWRTQVKFAQKTPGSQLVAWDMNRQQL